MRTIPCVLVALILGCGFDRQSKKSESSRSDSRIEKAESELRNAMAVSASKDPRIRIAAWQRKWIKKNEYRRPKNDVFETERDKFTRRWNFGERRIVLTLSEKPNLDDEDRHLLYTILIELSAEWAMYPQLIYEEDRGAGRKAVTNLETILIREAVKIERSTTGAVCADSYPISKDERIPTLQEKNQLAAQSLAYKTLLESGKKLRGPRVIGDVFSFKATV